jgi:hypothetical protein
MHVTKPYEFIGFGAMDGTKPYEFIGFGAMHATKPCEFIGFGTMHATKPCGPGLESDRKSAKTKTNMLRPLFVAALWLGWKIRELFKDWKSVMFGGLGGPGGLRDPPSSLRARKGQYPAPAGTIRLRRA